MWGEGVENKFRWAEEGCLSWCYICTVTKKRTQYEKNCLCTFGTVFVFGQLSRNHCLISEVGHNSDSWRSGHKNGESGHRDCSCQCMWATRYACQPWFRSSNLCKTLKSKQKKKKELTALWKTKNLHAVPLVLHSSVVRASNQQWGLCELRKSYELLLK